MTSQILRKSRNLLVYLLTMSLLPGCQSANSSMYDIEDYSPGSIMEYVSVGDYVELNTANRDAYAFEVLAIDENTISGQGIVINYSDIDRLEVRRERSTGSNAGTIVAAVLVVIVGIALLVAISTSSSNGGFLEGGLFQ